MLIVLVYNTIHLKPGMTSISINTSAQKEICDITDQLNSEIKKNKLSEGLINLFVKHTTVALTVADLDPGTDQDLLNAYQEMVPKLKYKHPHDPSHVGDHILSALIGVSLTLPVRQNCLELGMWQRVILAEFSGPRRREIILTFIKNTL